MARACFAVAVAPLVVICAFGQTPDKQKTPRDFSGSWRLNASRSDIRAAYAIPDAFLRVDQTPAALTLSARATENSRAVDVLYPLNGKSQKNEIAESALDVVTKWEGDALIVNTIVSGPVNYSAMERWVRSADGNRLTITRTIEGADGESISALLYDGAGVPISDAYILDPGTRILLRLTNAVNTKRSAPGDRVYLQTAAPIFVKGHLVIPQGSFVTGSVTESERAGHVKGRSALNIRFETLTLPNGVSRDFRSRAGSVDAQGSLDRAEGRITGDSNTGKDVKTVAGTTAAGTGIGTIAGAAAGNYGMGMGIGAAAGAVAGLAKVFGSRGPDVMIPQGTTMELVLDRELTFTSEEVARRNAGGR